MVGGVDCRYITAYAQVIMMKQTWLLVNQGSAALLPHRYLFVILHKFTEVYATFLLVCLQGQVSQSGT
jgi:hypothetical protein